MNPSKTSWEVSLCCIADAIPLYAFGTKSAENGLRPYG
ncbi:hypothetical protein AB395_00006857 (plasmid) [Sinorhizobium fredii CCBAU 45436]|nr:hypothetical protein AB395_00006857 [Sinorhizobium fredii CCBAU 45436]